MEENYEHRLKFDRTKQAIKKQLDELTAFDSAIIFASPLQSLSNEHKEASQVVVHGYRPQVVRMVAQIIKHSELSIVEIVAAMALDAPSQSTAGNLGQETHEEFTKRHIESTASKTKDPEPKKETNNPPHSHQQNAKLPGGGTTCEEWNELKFHGEYVHAAQPSLLPLMSLFAEPGGKAIILVPAKHNNGDPLVMHHVIKKAGQSITANRAELYRIETDL